MVSPIPRPGENLRAQDFKRPGDQDNSMQIEAFKSSASRNRTLLGQPVQSDLGSLACRAPRDRRMINVVAQSRDQSAIQWSFVVGDCR